MLVLIPARLLGFPVDKGPDPASKDNKCSSPPQDPTEADGEIQALSGCESPAVFQPWD